MRTKLVGAATAGVLALGGLAVAAPALAHPDRTGDAATAAAERVREALSGLVSDGSLTPEQADEVARTLQEAGVAGCGGHSGHGPDLATAAEALGMTEEELRTALRAGDTSLAQVAEDRGVPLDTLVAALVEAGRERIARAVEDGRITSEQADERLAGLEERVTERVEATDPRGPGGGHHQGHRSGEGPGQAPGAPAG